VLAALQGQGIDAHAFDPAEQPLDALKGLRPRLHRAARPPRRGRHDPGRARADAHSLHRFRRHGLGARHGQVPHQAALAGGRPAGARVRLADADSDFADVEEELGLPIFVKPAREGSSIGITKVKERDTLPPGLRRRRRNTIRWSSPKRA
jgi:D-alanine-D-alanine ligase